MNQELKKIRQFNCKHNDLEIEKTTISRNGRVNYSLNPTKAICLNCDEKFVVFYKYAPSGGIRITKSYTTHSNIGNRTELKVE